VINDIKLPEPAERNCSERKIVYEPYTIAAIEAAVMESIA